MAYKTTIYQALIIITDLLTLEEMMVAILSMTGIPVKISQKAAKGRGQNVKMWRWVKYLMNNAIDRNLFIQLGVTTTVY